jgi:hypothetical protein
MLKASLPLMLKASLPLMLKASLPLILVNDELLGPACAIP